MAPPLARPTTVPEYIKAAPKAAQKKLREIRACIRKAAPDAKEELKWGMPAYSYKRILVIYGGFNHHRHIDSNNIAFFDAKFLKYVAKAAYVVM